MQLTTEITKTKNKKTTLRQAGLTKTENDKKKMSLSSPTGSVGQNGNYMQSKLNLLSAL